MKIKTKRKILKWKNPEIFLVALNVVVGVDVGIGMCVSVGILSQYEQDMQLFDWKAH
jgi:hypothetical protein